MGKRREVPKGKKKTAREANLGPTGTYPAGKITPDDKGAIRVGIAADLKRQLVVLHFGTPIMWTAMPRRAALEYAALIIKNAELLNKEDADG